MTVVQGVLIATSPSHRLMPTSFPPTVPTPAPVPAAPTSPKALSAGRWIGAA